MDKDPRKQKRMGPAPIASFEKSFEDNTAPVSVIGMSNLPNLSSTTEEGGINLNNVQMHNMDNRYDNQLTGQQPPTFSTFRSPERPKVTPPDPPPQHPKPSSANITPVKKLHDISGKRIGMRRPPPIQCVVIPSSMDCTEDPPKSSTTLGVHTPSTPRIDISRASSSSQHEDSRESSPENVFEQVGTGQLQEAIGIGFREEGALDLRTSTEELFFMDPEQKKAEQERLKEEKARKSPVVFRFEDHQTYLQQHQRKDSASSEVAALLCISGRTSRVSSVGSQGSAVSRLSAISGVSRSPSPHRMLMETSFCGPKPLGNIVDGSIASSIDPTAEILEQVILARKHDPTQVVLAEGIKIETSPKKKPCEAGDRRNKALISEKKLNPEYKIKKVAVPKVGVSRSAARRDSSKQVIGVTPSGTEYIRINLKPDHLYDDKGIAPNERIVDISENGGKPSTLGLKKDSVSGRLTPSTSPKPVRHIALSKDVEGSRSPSPANANHSRKSSFCSLFKPKDSPDSPRDRSRSKSRERTTPQSQSGTPNKSKSVLAIFKPKRSGSKSKSSSPIDIDAMQQLDAISQVEFKFNTEPPQDRSRPPSRLRYYDTPPDEKGIYIPLHTPPEEKDIRKMLPTEPTVDTIIIVPINVSAQSPQNAKTSPPSISFQTETTQAVIEIAPSIPQKSTPKPQQLEKIQRIENLDAIHTLPEQVKEKERTWSLEVQRHSSQDSQDSCATVESTGPVRRKSRPNLDDVIESPVKENGITKQPPVVTQSSITIQQPQQQVTVVQPSQPSPQVISKEKKRILFATRIGSGSQEQIFSTQFSLSKTESLSSQLSEQASIPESPAESLQRCDTVLRRPEDKKKDDELKSDSTKSSIEVIQQSSTEDSKPRSKSSEDEKPVIVMMRKKDCSEDGKKKSRTNVEEDDPTQRHSRYLANFDVQKQRYYENNQHKNSLSRQSSSDIKQSVLSQEVEKIPQIPPKPTKNISDNSPHLPAPPPPLSDRASTDEPLESSESERDSEMDPNRVKRHLPRHIGVIEDHESTGLVSQESFEDELPYVPTTLPEERAQGVSIVPMKERVHMEIKTLSLDRPRSTTPMNPAHLEDYCATPDDNEHYLVRGEKLRISLPKKECKEQPSQKSKSPRRASNSSGKSWFEFAEQGIRGTTATNTTNTTTTITTPTHTADDNDDLSTPPPPLPPRKPSNCTQWVNFDNIPEKRKPPKRLSTIPNDSIDSKGERYNYVKPEECQCECHEVERVITPLKSETEMIMSNKDAEADGEDLEPLIDCHEGIDPSSDSSQDYDLDESGHRHHDERCNSSRQRNGCKSSGYSDSHDSADDRPPSNGARPKHFQKDQNRYQ